MHTNKFESEHDKEVPSHENASSKTLPLQTIPSSNFKHIKTKANTFFEPLIIFSIVKVAAKIIMMPVTRQL